MKHGSNIWHIIAAAVVSQSVFQVCMCFIIFLTKAFLDFELPDLRLVVVHKGIWQCWPRGYTLTYRGKVIWTFQCCAQNLAALKAHFFFFFILYNFSSFGLSVLVSSVRQCTGNKFSFSMYAHRAIVVTVRASLISSPQMTVVSYL